MVVSGVFVTGTDTEVGKTYVSARILSALVREGVRVGAYKPVASGCRSDNGLGLISDDAQQLWEAAGCPGRLEDVCPQRFAAPLAPPVAAAQEGQSIDEQLLIEGIQEWTGYEAVVVEGAGGLLSPLDSATGHGPA